MLAHEMPTVIEDQTVNSTAIKNAKLNAVTITKTLATLNSVRLLSKTLAFQQLIKNTTQIPHLTFLPQSWESSRVGQ